MGSDISFEAEHFHCNLQGNEKISFLTYPNAGRVERIKYSNLTYCDIDYIFLILNLLQIYGRSWKCEYSFFPTRIFVLTQKEYSFSKTRIFAFTQWEYFRFSVRNKFVRFECTQSCSQYFLWNARCRFQQFVETHYSVFNRLMQSSKDWQNPI